MNFIDNIKYVFSDIFLFSMQWGAGDVLQQSYVNCVLLRNVLFRNFLGDKSYYTKYLNKLFIFANNCKTNILKSIY